MFTPSWLTAESAKSASFRNITRLDDSFVHSVANTARHMPVSCLPDDAHSTGDVHHLVAVDVISAEGLRWEIVQNADLVVGHCGVGRGEMAPACVPEARSSSHQRFQHTKYEYAHSTSSNPKEGKRELEMSFECCIHSPRVGMNVTSYRN